MHIEEVQAIVSSETALSLQSYHAHGRNRLWHASSVFSTRWHLSQVSLLNFIQYNVVGGGESSLYGVESWPFYLINGALNFGVALPAALLLAPVALMGAMDITSSRITSSAAWAVSPMYVWFAAVSALPHKEERFLYVVYPQVHLSVSWRNVCFVKSGCLALSTRTQHGARRVWNPLHCRISAAAMPRACPCLQICLAASLTLSLLPRFTTDLAQAVFSKVRSSASRRSSLHNMVALAVLASILTSSALSASRIYGMLVNYSAPMHTWAQLSKAHQALRARGLPAGSGHGGGAPHLACVGAEWHRFPSSFFLPKGVELAFVEAGFDGALPNHRSATSFRYGLPAFPALASSFLQSLY